MSNKILLLDGQIFQTGAWHRGMGKYMLQVIKQLSEQTGEKMELKILFNSRIETDQARFETINYLGPNFEQLFVDLPLPQSRKSTSDQYKKALNHYVENSFGASKVTYIITTLFSFDIFAEYPSNAGRKAIIFYDLIPLMNWKDLGGYFPPDLYMTRFTRMYESDVVYCISETTKQDVLKTFRLDEARVVNINGGFTEHHLEAVKPKKFIMPKKYILFPTGNLPHKNNELVFRAMEQVVKEHKDIHLLVTSAFSDEAKARLLKLCKKNILFTQNVTDEELQYLYKHADMVLFASKYEGLGLPVLDAVFHNKPIVASSISVFREMTDDAFFFFEPGSPKAVAEAIHKALEPQESKKKFRHYPAILAKYDWKKIGEAILSHMDKPAKLARPTAVSSPKIAIVSLNAGIEGSIGRLSERLYGRLRGMSVTYFFDSCGLRHKDMERPTFLDYMDARVYDLSRLTLGEYRKFDKVVYLVDDMSLNFMMMEYVASLPGAIVYDSHINQQDPMFSACISGNKNTMPVMKNDEDLEALRAFIVKPLKPSGRVRMLKSWLPKRVKYEYLKKELSK